MLLAHTLLRHYGRTGALIRSACCCVSLVSFWLQCGGVIPRRSLTGWYESQTSRVLVFAQCVVDSQLLSMFADEPAAPYSIHNIAKYGMLYDKMPGDWFGPSNIAHVLKYAL